jgi:hypothetical protein
VLVLKRRQKDDDEWDDTVRLGGTA